MGSQGESEQKQADVRPASRGVAGRRQRYRGGPFGSEEQRHGALEHWGWGQLR
ncbi:hypothetical protein SH139x_002897 [Planctomycetaceae bacterium SH139]